MSIFEAPVQAYVINDTLNPILWDNDELRTDVRYKLLGIAKHFADTLKVKALNLRDITISGSNASFGYSEYSDIDLHLVVDMPDDEELHDYYNAKKNEFNNKYDVKIKDIDVEVYVQSSKQPHHSAGVYSILDKKWLHKPSKSFPKATPQEVKAKARNYSSKINYALSSKNLGIAKNVMDEIRRLRQAGLESGGENAVENLAFKLLRSRGKIDKLRNYIDKLQSAELSLGEEMKINDIINEAGSQAVITNYQPGKTIAVTMPDGTQIQKDLSKDPGAISKDEQGNPIFNLASQPSQGTMGSDNTEQNPLKTGSQIDVNLGGDIKTLETNEEDLEADDVISSGKNKKIGGDPTDEFINDVIDKKWERSARGSISSKDQASYGPIPGKLAETDELYKWLTIAGIK